ncbi:MAG: sugar ABC transporter substrate-binding protein [Rubrivivax sp.]|nr:sugar ABC transporter substrate-binding protein [Rubrivivax sp.]
MRLAVFTKNRSNPAYAAARLGAERVAARLGAEVRHYVPETPDDPVQQGALVLQALQEHPDAFVFTPVHPTRVNTAIAAVRAAGVPIFGFVNRMDPGIAVSYVGSSDAHLARDIAARLAAHLGGRGRIVVVEGPAESVTSRERSAAFDDVLARHPGLEVVARCSGEYLREPARLAFDRVLAAQPRIDGVLAANDIMAIGVLDALAAAGRDAAVVGVNAIPEAIAAILAGRMLATADFNAMQMAALATECAIRHLRGERVPADIELPVAIVDRHNAEAWDRPYEQRPLATLDEVVA